MSVAQTKSPSTKLNIKFDAKKSLADNLDDVSAAIFKLRDEITLDLDGLSATLLAMSGVDGDVKCVSPQTCEAQCWLGRELERKTEEIREIARATALFLLRRGVIERPNLVSDLTHPKLGKNAKGGEA